MDLRSRLKAWMNGEKADFSELSLEVFHEQFYKNPAYRNYCEALGKNPKNVGSWQQIPAVPTDVFKLSDLHLRGFSASEVAGYFLTSGTTQEIKGKHEFRDLELYAASILGNWRERGLPEIRRPWFFSQTLADAPYSSLVRMFSILDQEGSWLMDFHGKMRCEEFVPHAFPNALLGTSLALIQACEQMPACHLSEGSWIFETGGSKGLQKSLSPEEVRARLSTHFGVRENRILNEYGMTELFSQFYKWGDEKAHRGASWTAIRVVDVHTGFLAEKGNVGYLEVLDLANLDSVMAIRTQDLAMATGEREFILLGRDPGAMARGCSRGVEEVMSHSL